MVLCPRERELIEFVQLFGRVRGRSELSQEPLDDMLLDGVERIVRVLGADARR
jgi:hypothetical protein